MIQLDPKDYIAEGEIRKCYVHPDNKNLCLKVPKPEVTQKYIQKELDYFHKIRKKKQFEYLFFSKYQGLQKTNFGNGYSFDLIRDETTQEISLTLRHYLENTMNNLTDAILTKALLRLKKQMIHHKIFTRDLRPRNICCKILQDGSVEMVIIDGIGHRDFFPFADWFHFFAKKKVNRAFERAKIMNFDEQRSIFKELRLKGETII